MDIHPRLAIPPESHIFDHFGDLFDSYGNLENPKNLGQLVRDFFEDERLKRWDFQASAAEFSEGLAGRTRRDVISRLFELYTARHGKIRWGDKTPEHTLFLPEILKVFPDAQFIHLVRDGRDVAESLARMFFGPVTIDQKAAFWRRYVFAVRDFKKGLPPGQFLEIRYEELARSPGPVLAAVYRFLEEEVVGPPASLPDTHLKRVYLRTDDGSHQSLRLPVTDDKVGIFKNRLKPREIEIFESIAGDALLYYGYPLVSSGKSRVTFYEQFIFNTRHRLRFLNKLGHAGYLKDRIQFRLRKWSRTLFRKG